MPVTSSTTTSLNYAIVPSPDPLQVSNPASITIVISNIDLTAVSFNSIEIHVIYSQDLNSADALTTGGIDINFPVGWNPPRSSSSPGHFQFTPQLGNATLNPGASLLFALKDFQVNNQVGNTTLTIVSQYTTNGQSGAPSTQSESLSLGKFPQEFSLSELRADKPIVSADETVILNWVGEKANYTLKYDEQTITIAGQQNAAPYNYPFNLPGTTTFFLTATAGDGSTVSAEREYTVMVLRPEILGFGTVGNVTASTPGSIVKVYWQTQNAVSCDLYVNGVLVLSDCPPNIDPTQGMNVLMPSIPGTVNLVLCAYGSGGNLNGNGASAAPPATTSLPLFLLGFGGFPISSVSSVNLVQPFQLVPSADGSRLYVVGNYPGTLPASASTSDVTPSSAAASTVQDTSIPVGYLDLSNSGALYQPLDLSNYPIAINTSTPSLSRLATLPGNSNYLFWAKDDTNDAVRIDTTNSPSQQQWRAVYAVATGTNNQTQFLAIKYQPAGSIVTVGAYNVADLSVVKELDVTNQSLSWNLIWNVATNSTASTLLITTSLTNPQPGQNLYRYDVGSNSIAQIKLPNCYRSTILPSYVAFSSNDKFYYISGVDPTTSNSQPVIAVVDATSNAQIRAIPLSAQVRAMAVSPNGYHLFTTLADNSIVRVNVNTSAIDKVFTPYDETHAFWGLALNQPGTYLYITDIGDQKTPGQVWEFDVTIRG